MALKVPKFYKYHKGITRGFADVFSTSWGITIHGVCVFESVDGKRWASPPSKQRLNKDGTPVLAQDGKMIFDPHVSFASAEKRMQWSDAVIDALLEEHPDAFEEKAPTPPVPDDDDIPF